MANKSNFSRKSFLKKLGAASAGMVGAPFVASKAKKNVIQLERKPGITGLFSANDQINIAIIGAGGMGRGLLPGRLR